MPIHHRPWLSFHTDTWFALICSIASLAVILRVRSAVIWNPITLLAAVLLCIPWLQYLFGLIPMVGNAWISTAYLLGLLLALLTGVHWEMNAPGQLMDALFLAIGLAALVSVGLQLYGWLQLDGLGLLVMDTYIPRPHANFGQPNQLGTFLIWGLLAAAWGWLQKRISAWVAIFMATYLLFGIALTASRTAWIGVVLLILASWLWRRLWRDPRLPWVVTGLGFYFVLCIVLLGWLQSTSNFSYGIPPADVADVARMNGETRQLAWVAFADAISQKPWLGFGWNQSGFAQMMVAAEHPYLGRYFSYSHNLFFDLILWCGIPLGLLISILLLGWFWNKLRAVSNADNAVIFLFLLIVANHAMLELPLYFAYFLLPVGMVIGVLNVRLGAPVIMQSSRGLFFVIWLVGATLLGLIIRDYSRIESSYRILRMEWDNFAMSEQHQPPDVMLLTQWQEYIRYGRFQPKAGMTDKELDWMRNVTGLYPNMLFFNKIAMAMALNQRPDEAALWLKRLCKLAPEGQCLLVQEDWAKQSRKNPAIANVPWPIKTEK